VVVTLVVLAAAAPATTHAGSAVIGKFVGIDSAGIASGWAQDPDAPTASIPVHFYLDGPAGVGTYLAMETASIPQGPPGEGPHGFRFPLPSRLRDGAPHQLFVYGIDVGNSADNALLPGSPQTFTLTSTILRLTNGVIQLGIEPRCGGTVAELIVNGKNLVNNADCTGRQIQTAVYDGDDSYDSCGGCQGVWGWNPVQGGDVYGFGSPLSAQTVTSSLIHTVTQALEWYPDDKGGSVGRPVASDVTIEQTASFVPGYPSAVRLHYRISHLGSDSHGLAIQEFPAVYANLGFDHFVTYEGTAPWTGGPVTVGALPQPGSAVPEHYVPEHWAALVDDTGMGLTVYVPQQYPYVSGLYLQGSSGEYGWGANYFRPHVPFAFGPQTVLEADVYVIAGDYRSARQTIDAWHAAGPVPDILPPYGWVETLGANQTLTGTQSVSGWVFDDVHMSRVEVVMDGHVAGTAAYGSSRPDISSAFPHVAPGTGFSYALDSTQYVNGWHNVAVRAIDDAGNVAVLGAWTVVVSNVGDTTAPSVSITDVQTPRKRAVVVTVKASDNGGVTRVDLFADGQLVGSDLTDPYGFTLRYSSFSLGPHTFIAVAYDSAGNAGTSAPFTWTKK